MDKRYSIAYVFHDVNVSSSYNYSYTMRLYWGDKIRVADFDPSFHELMMHYKDRRREFDKSIVTTFPQYLWQDLNLAIYNHLLGKQARFFEYNRDHEKRYADLRYHCTELFHGQVRIVAGHLTPASYADMVDIFNRHMKVGQRFQTTSADGDTVISTGPAFIPDGDGTPRLPVRREDTGTSDRWLLKFVSPVFEESKP